MLQSSSTCVRACVYYKRVYMFNMYVFYTCFIYQTVLFIPICVFVFRVYLF